MSVRHLCTREFTDSAPSPRRGSYVREGNPASAIGRVVAGGRRLGSGILERQSVASRGSATEEGILESPTYLRCGCYCSSLAAYYAAVLLTSCC